MAVHQCPKCELRFQHRTELDDHCWHDHPAFRHEYPAVAAVVAEDAPKLAAPPAAPPAAPEHRDLAHELTGWLVPKVPGRHRDTPS